MASSSIFLLTLLFSTISSSTSFNITTILSPHPSFSSFNDLLSFTNISNQIRPLPSFTLLVVKNSALSAAAARPLPSLKTILSLHVLLGYYDQSSLRLLTSSTSHLLPTLFHATGTAPPHMGFLKVARNGGDIVFTSAADEGGDAVKSRFVKQIVSKPYNVSVIEIGGVIVPSGVTTVAFSPVDSPWSIGGESFPPVVAESVPPAYGLAPAGSGGLWKDENAAAPSPEEGVSSGGVELVENLLGALVLICVSNAAISL